jgi:predicted transcriptional regulator
MDIIESILIKAGNGCRKTRIMYGANLSTVQLRRYLNILVRIGCLTYDGENQLYKVSQKGIDLLEAISEVSRAKEGLRKSKERLDLFIALGHTSEDPSSEVPNISKVNRLLDTTRYTSKFMSTLADLEGVGNRQ